MPRTPLRSLLGVVATLLVLALAPGARAASGPTVPGAIEALRAAGSVTAQQADAARATYAAAIDARRELTGRRRAELAGAIASVTGVARRRGLSASRLPLAMLTLRRNREQWTAGRLLAYGERVAYPGSELIWQAYPGQGVQLQWLASFGKANALDQQGLDDRERLLLDEALGLAAQRAGGLAFESWFSFAGGRPPWVSGLGQGTGLQALARAGTRLDEPRYLEAERAGQGIFRTAPPEGVALATPTGTHFLQYSQAPRLRVLNGFVQALNALHDVAGLTGDAAAQQLFVSGDGALRAELPQADTGAWSRYSVGGKESDLGYHRLLRDFLVGLCTRMRAAGEDATPYCTTADRFTADLTTPPRVVLTAPATAARRDRPVRVRAELTKVSSVRVTVERAGRVVLTRTARWAGGVHVVGFTPRAAGRVVVRVAATDLAGNGGNGALALPVR